MGIIAPEHIFVDSDERDVALEAWYGECRAQIAYYSPNGDYLFILKAFHLATSIRHHIKCTCWYSLLKLVKQNTNIELTLSIVLKVRVTIMLAFCSTNFLTGSINTFEPDSLRKKHDGVHKQSYRQTFSVALLFATN